MTRLLLRRAGERLPDGQRWGEVSLVFGDDAELASLNERLFGRAGTTDVISLPFASVPGDNAEAGGEIFVNTDQAIRGAAAIRGGRSRRWGPAEELALYMAHGCDHLTGASDLDRPGRARMRRRELRWIAQANKAGLVDGLAKAEPSRAGKTPPRG
ncbi:MAG: rRNA maturation RNAse YbeY [Lentisphaerae bacterium]|nr:rRNA maturation RNAse YbeY [Lentisphaerota bacterium]